MSNDLQATITMQLGQALSSLKNVSAELKTMKRDVSALKAEKNSFQQQAAAGYQRVAGEAKKTTAATASMTQSMRQAGSAFGRFGGVAGELANRLGGAAGLSGAFGVVGIAATVAGISFRSFMAVADASADRIRAAREEMERFHKAVKSGQDTVDGQADAGMRSEKTVRQLMFRGGSKAVEQAESTAMSEGLDFDDVASGDVALMDVDESVRDRARRSALTASRSGMISYSEAAKSISSDPAMLARLAQVQQSGDTGWDAVSVRDAEDEIAARAIRKTTATDDISRKTGSGWEDIDMSRLRYREIETDPYLDDAAKTRRIDQQNRQLERNRVRQGRASTAASRRLTRAVNPVAANVADVQEENARKDAIAAELEADESTAARIARDFTQKEGSLKTQRTRTIRAQAAGAGSVDAQEFLDAQGSAASGNQRPIRVEIVRDSTIRPQTY